MHKLRYTAALLGAVAAFTALPAMAQDTQERDPFDGGYIGGSFGYGFQPNDVGETIVFDRNLDGRFGDAVTTAAGANAFSPGFCNGSTTRGTPAGGCRNDDNGIEYYARAGFDTQNGHVVIGAVGEFGRAEITDSVTGFSTTPASYTLTRKLDYETTIRGRVGLAFGPGLFYGTFGAGYARVKNRFTTTNTANAFADNGDDGRWGATGGGGVELKVARNVSFGLEYMFHRYQDDDYRVRVSRGGAPATNAFVLAPNTTGTDIARTGSDFRWHSIRTVLAFRF